MKYGRKKVYHKKSADTIVGIEEILDKENLNKAYKHVKANKGAPGVDGVTVDEAYENIT